MKTSHFFSPSHPSKICDIVVETVIDTYYKEGIEFYSDLFALIYKGSIHLHGHMEVSSPISDSELIPKIQKEIGTEHKIVNNIIVHHVDDIKGERTFGGIYLGYSCNEVDNMIPFEHEECRGLTKKIWDILQIPIKIQIHVNGQRLAISMEHNHENKEELENIVFDYFTREDDGKSNVYNKPEIYHSEIRTDVVYKSNDSIISSFYGPRAWYGETDFIGSDFLSNKRLGHLIVREIANDWAKKNNLSYVAVEIDFTDNNPVPIHFGIKGNDRGIHLENGTFFEFGDINNDYPRYKQIVLDKLKTGEYDIVEIAKWGFPSINI